MKTTSLFIFLAAATSLFTTTFAQPHTIKPVLPPSLNRHSTRNIRPSRNLTLSYGDPSSSFHHSGVNVSLAMRQPTVLLESIAAIASVDCSATSVAITFNGTEAFNTTKQDWPENGGFVMITNNMGDCDEELERGFFRVLGLSWEVATLTVIASSLKGDISSVAETAEITFGNLHTTALDKRYLILDPSFSIPVSYALPPSTTLFTAAPYLTATADSATFATNLTISGYLRYNFLHVRLEALTFDIDTIVSTSATISTAIEASYSTTLSYDAPALTYSLVSIPGILALGPALIFGLSADVNASAAVDVTTTLGLSIADGNVHLDALDSSLSSSSGWTPEYDFSANVSNKAEVDITPKVSVTVEMQCEILGGLVDLSTGLTAKAGFPTRFLLDAGAGVDLNGVVGEDESTGVCAQGLAVESDFVFELDAFVTQWYETTLYEYNTTIADVCYTFES